MPVALPFSLITGIRPLIRVSPAPDPRINFYPATALATAAAPSDVAVGVAFLPAEADAVAVAPADIAIPIPVLQDSNTPSMLLGSFMPGVPTIPGSAAIIQPQPTTGVTTRKKATLTPAGGTWSVAATWAEGFVPDAQTDVVLNASSGALTINSAASCASLEASTYTRTVTQTFTLNVGGLTLDAMPSWLVLGPSVTWTTGFSIILGGGSLNSYIRTSGAKLPFITISPGNGAKGIANAGWALLDDLNLSGTLSCNAGTLTTNGYAVTCDIGGTIGLGANNFAFLAANSNLTASSLTLNVGTVDITNANLTLLPSTASVNSCTATSVQNLTITGVGTSGRCLVSVNNIVNLTIADAVSAVRFGVTPITISGAFTVQASSRANGVLLFSNISTSAITIDLGATGTFTGQHVAFRSMAFIGTNTPLDGTPVGAPSNDYVDAGTNNNAGTNSGIINFAQEPQSEPLGFLYGAPTILGFGTPLALMPSGQDVAAAGVVGLFTPPEGDAVASAPTPLMLLTYLPAEADAVAAGAVPALLATFQPAEGDATAAGNVPALLDTRTPSEGDATAAGLVPAMLITFGAPVAGAVAASPVPFMEITADPAQQPLTFMGGLTRIGVSGPLLQQSTSPVGDVAAVSPVLFAVPVAAATGVGLVPTLLDTRTPTDADVAVSSSTNGLTNTFEGGTNGVAISTGNSGGSSGDAFGNVNGTVTYSSTAARGTLSATVLEPNGGTATAFVAFTGLGSLTTQTWGRAYYRMDTVPTQTVRILSLQTFAGTVCAGLTVTTAGLLRAQNSTPTAIGTASTAIPLNQWFRVEYRLIPDTSVGEIEFRAWFNAESSGTPDWVSNNVGQTLGANLSQTRFGITSGPTTLTADWNLWVDEVNGVATTWPGPASALPPAMQLTYAAPVASAVSAGFVPLMEFTSDPAMQPLVMLGGLPRIGISGPLLQQSTSPVGDVTSVSPVLFAVPVASAVGAGAVPVLLDTRQPSEGDTTAVGQVPALLGTWQPSVAAATADGNTPALLDTRAPAVAAATAAGNAPVLLITFTPGVAGAVAAAAVPLMEITSDPAMQPPLVFLGGLPRIGISGPLLQQSTSPVGDVTQVSPVLFAVPVAAATSVGLTPVLMATFAPAAAGATAVGNVPAWPWAAPVGSATASSPAPVWLDTHLPGVASATGAGQLPVLQVTYSIVVASGTAASAVPAWPWSVPVASATAASPTPALLITFAPPEGDAVAAAQVAVMAFALAVTQDPFQLPFWGPLRTIPGSMTILKEQDPGSAASSLLLAVPVASASSAGLVPTLLETYAAGVASVTAAGLTPAMLATALPFVAAATAAGQAPVVQATYIAGVASATAAGLTPVQAATYGITVASAAAAGLAPVGVGTIKPGAASATAAANTPVYSAAYLPATSVVSAAAPVVVLKVTFTPAVGLVTSVALVPVYDAGTSGGVHFIYAAEARTTMQSIAAVTLTGMAGATTRTAAPAGTGQGQAGRTGSTGNLDP